MTAIPASPCAASSQHGGAENTVNSHQRLPRCVFVAWNPWALFFKYLWRVFWGYLLPEFILSLFPVQSSNRNGASSSSIHGKPALMNNLINLSLISDLQLQSRCCSGGYNKSWITSCVISFLGSSAVLWKMKGWWGGWSCCLFLSRSAPRIWTQTSQLKSKITAFTRRSLSSAELELSGGGSAKLGESSPPCLCTPLGNTFSLSSY